MNDDPLNPYASPSLPAESVWDDQPPQVENRFVDAFSIGTWLLRKHFLLIVVIVAIVWIPINLWLSYYELFVIEEDDFSKYFRMTMAMEGLFGVVGAGAILAVGKIRLNDGTPTLSQAFGESVSQWGRFVIGGILSNILISVGLVCLVLPGIYISTCLIYFMPVLIVERMSLTDTFKRCFVVGRRRFWFSLGLMLSMVLLPLLAGVVTGLASLALSLLELPLNVTWITNAMLTLPDDLVVAWCWLVTLAAYYRLRTELAAETADEDVPTEAVA